MHLIDQIVNKIGEEVSNRIRIRILQNKGKKTNDHRTDTNLTQFFNATNQH